MKPETNQAASRGSELVPRVFAGLFGGLLGLSLLKFGNPVVLEQLIEWPTNIYEWVLNPWPIAIGYGLLGGVAVIGLFVAPRVRPRAGWLTLLPLVWLAWQFVAGSRTINIELTRLVLPHFVACVVCFYLGLFALSRTEDSSSFLIGLLCGFLLVIGVGVQQHFGGLEASREFFYQNIYPQLKEVPADYLKKISSDRIFSTLFYPNALAGVLLLLLPPIVVFVWQRGRMLSQPARRFFALSVLVAGLACLYWSGSKGGWLLMLLLGLVAVLHLRFSRRLKLSVVAVVLMLGLVGFSWRYAAFFQKGATSVVARFDCWRAALQTARENPVWGSGPGTFAIVYRQVKRPEAEMSRLVHNDYLQQASDSGFAGFLAYSAFIVASLWWAYSRGAVTGDRLGFSVWLGLLGCALQGLLEFGLYIPALAWLMFALIGWLLGASRIEVDKFAASR